MAHECCEERLLEVLIVLPEFLRRSIGIIEETLRKRRLRVNNVECTPLMQLYASDGCDVDHAKFSWLGLRAHLHAVRVDLSKHSLSCRHDGSPRRLSSFLCLTGILFGTLHCLLQ